MNIEDCFELGYIAKAHGIAGEVRAVFEVTDIRKYRKKESVWLLRQGKLAPFSIESFHILNEREALLAFKEVADRDDAEELPGSKMYLPLKDLPPAPKGKFYFHEVPGFTVVDEKLGQLGTVRGVIEMPAQNLVEMNYENAEVLIPVTPQIVKGIDREKKEMYTCLPEGLLEVYLSPAKEGGKDGEGE